MKTDRELLELAAKSSGYEFDSAALCGGPELALDGMRIIGLRLADGSVWNPLTDDGDALRLAHALGMQLNLDECNDMNDVRTDIVMAAAAIGEQTK